MTSTIECPHCQRRKHVEFRKGEVFQYVTCNGCDLHYIAQKTHWGIVVKEAISDEDRAYVESLHGLMTENEKTIEEQLTAALSVEDYETAARIRDQIKELQNG